MSPGLSVHLVHCGKTADRIRMLFGMVGRTGPWMRQVVGYGEWAMGSSNFGGKYGRPIVTSGDFTIGNSQCAAERLLLGEFLQLQARQAGLG